MMAFKEIPEIADKIAEGKLSLSSVAMVQKTLRRESKNQSQHKSRNFNAKINITSKKALFKSIESKSQRVVEQVLVQKFPQAHLLNKSDSIRAISSEKSEIKFVADEDLLIKLQNCHPTYNELLHLMADQVLAKSEKKMKRKATPRKRVNLELEKRTKVNPATKVRSAAPSQRQKKLSPSRYISKSVKQDLYLRDNGSCQYVDPFSKKKCNSKHLTQIDHIKAYSKGGGSEINNLQFLCSGHNQLKANK